MSKQNVELVKALMPDEIDLAEVLRSEDPVASFAGIPPGAFDPDIEVVFEPSAAGGPGLAYRGLEGLIAGWRDWLTPWESYRIRIDEYIDAGDDVVVNVSVSGLTGRHGVEVAHRPSSVWRVREGRIVAAHFFLDRDEALRFAGVDT